MSNEARIIEVKGDDDGQRLDRWLKRVAPDLPYVLVQKLLRKGQIRIDGKRAKPDTRLEQGQEVRLPPKDCKSKPVNKTLNAEDIAYIKSLVIYDDGDVVALNKPYDLAVQGGTKMQRHVDGLLEGLKNKEGIKPRLVHRLDKD
ncbi:MAG: S4 domain-containing protein, partial [Alphaproteobacteria bacterium]